MADPFTIVGTVGAAIGIIDVTIRLGQSLKKTLAEAPNVHGVLSDLQSQIDTLVSINNKIRIIICAPEFSQPLDTSTTDKDPLKGLWKELWHDTTRILEECQRVLEKLDALIKHVQGADRDAFISVNDPDEQRTQAQLVSGRG